MKKSIATQKKNINVISIIATIMCAITIFIIPTAFADDSEFIASMEKQITSSVYETLNECLSGTFYQTMIGEETYTAITTFNTSIRIFAAFWVIIIALGRLFTSIDKGQDPKECIFRCLIEIGANGFIITNLDAIINAIMGLGTIAIGYASQENNGPTIAATGTSLAELITGKPDGGFAWFMKAFATLLIPWLFSWIIVIMAKLIIFKLLFELGIRRACAPLAVADIYDEGLRSPGMRYFKKFFGVFLKIAVCFLVCSLSTNMTVDAASVVDESGAFKYMFDIVAVNLTCIGVMSTAQEITNDVIGA